MIYLSECETGISSANTGIWIKPAEIERESAPALLIPEMSIIPGGTFNMGSTNETREMPIRPISVKTFAIGKYEVTNAEWTSYKNWIIYTASLNFPGQSSDLSGNSGDQKKFNHPVVNVSWEEANGYCVWLRERTDRKFRLPTEAEWEYAARGPNNLIFPWGNDWNMTNAVFNRMRLTRGQPGASRTTVPVRDFADGVNWTGNVFHMSGNAAEWVNDWDGRYDADKIDRGSIPEDELRRIIHFFKIPLAPILELKETTLTSDLDQLEAPDYLEEQVNLISFWDEMKPLKDSCPSLYNYLLLKLPSDSTAADVADYLNWICARWDIAKLIKNADKQILGETDILVSNDVKLENQGQLSKVFPKGLAYRFMFSKSTVELLRDAIGRTTCKSFRGGSWSDTNPNNLRTSSRNSTIPSQKADSIGFRVAEDVIPLASQK